MSQGNYEIRTMTRAEVDIALDWAAVEGWNPGLHDADCFFRTDPQGFIMGFLDGDPIGCISAVSYGKSYGFLGFYIVKPNYRSRGFGIKLWDEAIKRLSGRNMGLDGVVAQQDNYRKSGFKLAHRNIRYQWRAAPSGTVPQGLTQLSEAPKAALAAYDTELFGTERSLFLQCWINLPEAVALGAIEGGEMRGYGVLRKCRTGFKIGPLFANSYDLAERLFLGLTANLPAEAPVFLDVPEVNSMAVQLAEKYGCEKVFETARMYTQAPPKVSLDRWFGVTTFELG
jgi:ribosomal protein S18 acetylase RimI-like enzyme